LSGPITGYIFACERNMAEKRNNCKKDPVQTVIFSVILPKDGVNYKGNTQA